MAGTASVQNGRKGGRPKGRKNQATLEKEAILREYRQKVLQAADILFGSQLHLARGVTYLYKIEKELQIGPKGGKKYVKSKPKLVTEQWEIESYLMGNIVDGDVGNDQDPDATYYFLTTEKPDNRAIDSMLDRTFGRATQPLSSDPENPLVITFDDAFTSKTEGNSSE